MSNVARDVSVFVPMENFIVGEGIILAPMYMHFSMRKISQSAAVVEVHMCKDDVSHVFGFVPQPFHLINRSLVRVEWHIRNNSKELREGGRIGVIFQAKTCVDENQILICFGQKTNQPRFQIAKTGIACEAIENVESHSFIYPAK